MVNQDEDKNIKKMAQLLRNGSTMLDLTCPECDNILFRLKNGKIMCPSCEKEVIIKKDSEISQEEIKSHNSNTTDINQKKTNFKSILIILNRMIKNLTVKMEEIDQIETIKQYINIIDSIVELYNKISKID